MHKSGLNASTYSGSGQSERYRSEPGNWSCPTCGSLVSLRRQACPQCSADTSKSEIKKISNEDLPRITHIHQEKLHHPPVPVPLQNFENRDPNIHSGQQGLSTSYWARAPGRGHKFDVGEVWKRTTTSKPRPSRPISTPLTPPDLGLPYEVQHYILTTMQRIIEEGCWTFASRWIPEVLYARHWTCAEQVELKTWRDDLPALLPPGAITPLSSYSLEIALKDAVGVRNAASHRHLCDNIELKKMAHQADGLMSLFGDMTRQNKFHLLWLAINNWDTETLDQETKRERLEQALRQISERPLNDMDWSPNTTSLQEIAPPEIDDEVEDDPMDMD